MHERHIVSDDFLSTLGDAVFDLLEKKTEELKSGIDPTKIVPQGLKRQDILGLMRLKNDPVEYRNAEALKIMAEVRSYYDCTYLSRSIGRY